MTVQYKKVLRGWVKFPTGSETSLDGESATRMINAAEPVKSGTNSKVWMEEEKCLPNGRPICARSNPESLGSGFFFASSDENAMRADEEFPYQQPILFQR